MILDFGCTPQYLNFVNENPASKEDHAKYITKNTKPVEEHSSWLMTRARMVMGRSKAEYLYQQVHQESVI